MFTFYEKTAQGLKFFLKHSKLRLRFPNDDVRIKLFTILSIKFCFNMKKNFFTGSDTFVNVLLLGH